MFLITWSKGTFGQGTLCTQRVRAHKHVLAYTHTYTGTELVCKGQTTCLLHAPWEDACTHLDMRVCALLAVCVLVARKLVGKNTPECSDIAIFGLEKMNGRCSGGLGRTLKPEKFTETKKKPHTSTDVTRCEYFVQ